MQKWHDLSIIAVFTESTKTDFLHLFPISIARESSRVFSFLSTNISDKQNVPVLFLLYNKEYTFTHPSNESNQWPLLLYNANKYYN